MLSETTCEVRVWMTPRYIPARQELLKKSRWETELSPFPDATTAGRCKTHLIWTHKSAWRRQWVSHPRNRSQSHSVDSRTNWTREPPTENGNWTEIVSGGSRGTLPSHHGRFCDFNIAEVQKRVAEGHGFRWTIQSTKTWYKAWATVKVNCAATVCRGTTWKDKVCDCQIAQSVVNVNGTTVAWPADASNRNYVAQENRGTLWTVSCAWQDIVHPISAGRKNRKETKAEVFLNWNGRINHQIIR